MAGTTTRISRNAELVRTYLQSLADSSGNSKSGRSLESLASEMEMSTDDLRAFRDGDEGALSSGLITTFAKLLGSDAVLTGMRTSPDEDMPRGLLLSTHNLLMRDEVGRAERLRKYDEIDKTRTEAHSALDAWADLGCTGGVGDPASRRSFVPEYQGKSASVRTALGEIEEHINTYIVPPHVKLQIFRGMAKNGDEWGEIGLQGVGLSQFEIGVLEPRHTRTMFVKRDENGRVDPKSAYIQKYPGSSDTTEFAAWQIARFSNQVEWGAWYGESIFEPCLRSYIQLEAVEGAMIIRRLTRAPLRLHHILDVGHVHPDEMEKAIRAYKIATKKRRIYDNGKNGQVSISLPPEEDLYSAKRTKDSPSDIKAIDGDSNIGEMADVLHFFNKWLAGLGPPKAHLGYESDTMRSVITDLHIVFARKVRRMQMKFMTGLNHLYWVSLVLRGLDPRKVPYLIVPPTMGTRDELVRAQVMQAYATTIKYLSDAFGVTGNVPTIQWFLKFVLNLNDDAIEALELSKVMDLKKTSMKNAPKSGLGKSDAVQLAAAAIQSDAVSKEVELTGLLLGERAIARGATSVLGVSRSPFEQNLLVPPSVANVELLARSLGRASLRSEL